MATTREQELQMETVEAVHKLIGRMHGGETITKEELQALTNIPHSLEGHIRALNRYIERGCLRVDHHQREI